MFDPQSLAQAFVENWSIWVVTITLIVAAVIDGWKLKVPNYITFPMILSGWVYSTWAYGLEGLGWSLVGTVVGLALLLPLYAIGGMGAGDVKLLAGVGAWIGAGETGVQDLCFAFALSALIGAVIALGMVVFRRKWGHHHAQFWSILGEIWTIRDPEQLATIAADRKSTMLLLPYGIPIAIGTIIYFAWFGMLL